MSSRIGMEKFPTLERLKKIKLKEIPINTPILGMAPIGIPWEGKMTRKGIKPNGNCPQNEFAPCFAYIKNIPYEIIR